MGRKAVSLVRRHDMATGWLQTCSLRRALRLSYDRECGVASGMWCCDCRVSPAAGRDQARQEAPEGAVVGLGEANHDALAASNDR